MGVPRINPSWACYNFVDSFRFYSGQHDKVDVLTCGVIIFTARGYIVFPRRRGKNTRRVAAGAPFHSHPEMLGKNNVPDAVRIFKPAYPVAACDDLSEQSRLVIAPVLKQFFANVVHGVKGKISVPLICTVTVF